MGDIATKAANYMVAHTIGLIAFAGIWHYVVSPNFNLPTMTLVNYMLVYLVLSFVFNLFLAVKS